MLVKNYCNKIAKEFGGKYPTICPAKDNPSLCKFGKECWINPTEATEEIKGQIYNNYKDFYEGRNP